MEKKGRVSTCDGVIGGQLFASLAIDVQENDLRTLRGEMFDERSADPGCTACDENQLVSQTGIGGKALLSSHRVKVYNT